MIFKPKANQATKQLKAQITKLQQENTELKAYLREIIETAYRAINQPAADKELNELNPEEMNEWRQKMHQEKKDHE